MEMDRTISRRETSLIHNEKLPCALHAHAEMHMFMNKGLLYELAGGLDNYTRLCLSYSGRTERSFAA